MAQVIASRGVLHPPWLARLPHAQSDRSTPRRVITRTVADEIAEMMRAVVSYGTGTQAQSSIATVNGKTGTAEVGPDTTSDEHTAQKNHDRDDRDCHEEEDQLLSIQLDFAKAVVLCHWGQIA